MKNWYSVFYVVYGAALVFMIPFYKDSDTVITVTITSIGLILALNANAISKQISNFDFLIRVLNDVEADLKGLTFEKMPEIERATSDIGDSLLKGVKDNIKKYNGLNYSEVYQAYWYKINNDFTYIFHFEHKPSDKPIPLTFQNTLISLNYYLIDKLNYSNGEVIKVIELIDEFNLPFYYKKFLYRKIRRITWNYYWLLRSEGGVSGYTSVVNNKVTKYDFDIPYIEDIYDRTKFVKTTLFKKHHFDELFKLLEKKNVINVGKSMGENRPEFIIPPKKA